MKVLFLEFKESSFLSRERENALSLIKLA